MSSIDGNWQHRQVNTHLAIDLKITSDPSKFASEYDWIKEVQCSISLKISIKKWGCWGILWRKSTPTDINKPIDWENNIRNKIKKEWKTTNVTMTRVWKPICNRKDNYLNIRIIAIFGLVGWFVIICKVQVYSTHT